MIIPRKRILQLLTVTICSVFALVLVVLSPLALLGIASFHHADWTILGNIGQTYGAVSALLAALALVGVAFSVALQVRESRANRLEAGRTRHFELSKIALEDPLFMQIEAAPTSLDINTRRLVIYINLQLQFWKMLWDFGELSEVELRRSIAPSLFATNIGRYYWVEFGIHRDELLTATRSDHRFEQILNAAYKESVRSKPVTVKEPRDPSGKHSSASYNVASSLARAGILVAIGIALGRLLGRPRH